MLAIKNGVNTNASGIAKQFGLTKGAISQTLSRLEKKGIINKTKDPYKKNELTLSLTNFGEETAVFLVLEHPFTLLRTQPPMGSSGPRRQRTAQPPRGSGRAA